MASGGTGGGSFYALLTAGTQNQYSLLTSNTFTAVSGDVLRFDAIFSTSDYLPFDDDGFVNLIDTSTSTFTTLFSSSVGALKPTSGATSSDAFASTGWQSVNYSFLGSGAFQIQAGVRNLVDNGSPGAPTTVGVDNFSLQTVTAPVPEPGTMSLMALGLTSLVGAARRRKKKEEAGFSRLSQELEELA